VTLGAANFAVNSLSDTSRLMPYTSPSVDLSFPLCRITGGLPGFLLLPLEDSHAGLLAPKGGTARGIGGNVTGVEVGAAGVATAWNVTSQ
jgi:hypothetical protein